MLTVRQNLLQVLILTLMVAGGGCSSQPQIPQPLPGQIRQIPQNQQPESKRPNPRNTVKEFTLPEVEGIVREGDPITITGLNVIKEKNGQRSLQIEFENVSDKPVKLWVFMFNHPSACPEFMYKLSPSPWYGDGALMDPKYKGLADPILYPGQKGVKTFKGKDYSKMLSPGIYKGCPFEPKKPHLILRKVWFADGTIWDPVEAEMQYRKSQQQKPAQ